MMIKFFPKFFCFFFYSKFGKSVVVASNLELQRFVKEHSEALQRFRLEKRRKALITVSVTLKVRAGPNSDVFSQLNIDR